jgi:rRNA-processing protein EBP2
MGGYSSDSEDTSMDEEELELEKAALGMLQRENNQGKSHEEKKEYIYNVDAIHERLEDISRVDLLAWEETLVCTSSDMAEMPSSSVHDDLERELAFYNQAMASVKESVENFDSLGTKWRRPTDYFAEMVKSDDHMKRVKEKLLYEKKLGEEQEERRKQREAKKYSKQVQAEKLKERAQAKNKQINSLKEWRKQRQRNGTSGDGNEDGWMDLDKKNKNDKRVRYEDLHPNKNDDDENHHNQRGRGGSKPEAGTRIFSGAHKSKQRQARDKKFGHGGRKKIQKQNDSKSAADMSTYRQGQFSLKGGKAKKGKKQRPGKAKRKAARGML